MADEIPTKHHDHLWQACPIRDEDYTPFGKDERWSDNRPWADCSGGCKFYYLLETRDGEVLGMDWGVCTNPKSHRCGLLTFEHQGCHHFELAEKDLHASDCARHNAPAFERGECDCGATAFVDAAPNR